MFKRYWTTCSKHGNQFKPNNEHNLGEGGPIRPFNHTMNLHIDSVQDNHTSTFLEANGDIHDSKLANISH